LRFLQDVGLTIGGRPGARFAERHTIAVSRMTLLRLVRSLPEPPDRSPSVLGVDDFALRRGYRYGTVFVDVAESEVIDLQADRSATALKEWLASRQPPQFICRDRAGEYASGARQGAPEAIQIADRFHLARNSSEVLERVLQRHGPALRACVQEDRRAPLPSQDLPAEATTPPTKPPRAQRARLVAGYERVKALHQQGWLLADIGAEVGLSQPTVRKYVWATSFPEWGPRRTALGPGTRHGEHLRTRWRAGVHDATVLWQEVRAQGYRGTLRSVQRAVRAWRDRPLPPVGHTPRGPRPAPAATWDHRPPSPTRAAWLLLGQWETLTPEEQQLRQRLLAAAPEVEQAHAAISSFRQLLHERDASALMPWLALAAASPVREVRAFAASVRKDQAAVQAALEYAWSSGCVEGHITRIKLVRRQMYGRGSLDLLKRRVMLAS
jgi:transposase